MCIVRSHFRSRFASCSLLGVQNSCVQPGAMEGPENQFPAVIRVGKPEYNYIYTYKGNATYKCERGSDWKVGNEVLWLMKEDGKWYAFDAPPDQNPTSVDPDKVRFVSTGTFSTEAHREGKHPWIMMMSQKQQVSNFYTTILDE